MLKKLLDNFAEGLLLGSPLFEKEKGLLTDWAKRRSQKVFNEHAEALAVVAADNFFKDLEHENWDYCFVTVVPTLKGGGIHMKVITEAGLSFGGIHESVKSDPYSHIKSYRRKFERPGHGFPIKVS
ncbi:hypothetical protein ACFL2Q_16450 [Thermodesulfobacteriota bacterium]